MASDGSPSADPSGEDGPPAAARPRTPLARARRAGLGTAAVPYAAPRPGGPGGGKGTDAAPAGPAELVGDPVVPAPGTQPPITDAAAAPLPSRAGRNLPAAIGVGVGLGAVIIVTLFVYRASFAVLVGLFVTYGAWELARAVRPAGIHVAVVPVLVGGVAIMAAAWLRGPSGLVLAAAVTVVGILAWRVGDGADGYARDTTASALAVLYLPTLGAFALLLAHPDDGAARVIAFVATVVCSDTGGYATGVLFGRHPLAPIVSKGKTWEGFAGSVLFCSAAGVLLLTLTFHSAWWHGLLFGLAIVATATVGDLGESMIKRDLGVKDMGTLLPGHGGVMDRLDSLLPCAAVAYLLLSAFAPV